MTGAVGPYWNRGYNGEVMRITGGMRLPFIPEAPGNIGFMAVCAVLASVLLAAMGLAGPTYAQEGTEMPRTVRVGLYESPPFVTLDGGRSGMAIDLWEALADELGVTSEYRTFPTIRDIVDAAADGEIDVALTNLTITQRRAQRIDFTQPWFDAGLRILVNDEEPAGFWKVVEGLRDSGHLRAYGWLALIIVGATVLLTVFDRYFDKDFPRRWREGIAESFYAVMSVATSGRAPARKNLFGWAGRIWQGLWLVSGVAVLAYVTSSVTSVMTTLSLTGQINSLDDLPGKPVGVFTGSVAEEFARDAALSWRSLANVDVAVAALQDGRIEAIIADAPVLEYYAHSHPDKPLSVVGPIFEPDKYGFGLQRHSPLTRPLTVELLGAHESGLVEQLRAKYFGSEN